MYRANIPSNDVWEVYRDGRTATFEWRILDYSQLHPTYSASPAVNYSDSDWRLAINKNRSGIHCVYLNRKPLTPGIQEPFRFTIVYRTPDGGEEDIVRGHTLSGGCSFSRPYRPRTQLASDGFTLTCTLWREGVSRDTQTEDAYGRNDETRLEVLSSLSEHLKNVLLSGDGHDVLIKVQDKQFRAHKHILKARSPVFAAMFSNEMAESAEGSVTIEDCDPDAFGEFLQFVYSGAVDIAKVSSALGLYYAGDKYDFPRLKEICVQFLKNSFTTTTVFDVINFAARHDEEELMQKAIVYFANNLEEVMLTVEWQRFLSANPIEANEMSLKAVQCLKTSLYKK